MKYHDEGMDLGACLNGCATQVGGVIGDQLTFTEDGTNYYTSGNRYEGQTGAGDYPGNGGATFSIASVAPHFDVYNLNPYIPLTNGFAFGGFAISPSYQNSPINFPIPEDCQNIIVEDLSDAVYDQVNQGEQIVLNGNQMSSNDEVIEYYLNKDLFERLKRDYSLVDSSTILYNFYDSTSQNTMGQLVDLKLAVEYIYDASTGNYTPQAIQARINDAGNLATAINPQNLIEDNERRIYDVIINHFANPETTTIDTLAIMSISDIAAQCPYIGGPSVYQARALMMLIDPVLKFDDDNYCASIPLRMANKNHPETKKYGLFYPNPTSGSVNLIYDLSDFARGELMIHNSISQIVKSIILNTKLEKQEINLNKLSSGIYNCRLIGDDKLVDEFKLSIVR